MNESHRLTATTVDPAMTGTAISQGKPQTLARDRAGVQVVLDDGGVVSGTLDRVGADYVELAEHPADLPRRAEAVQGVRAIVIAAVAVVRTGAAGLS